MDIVFLGDVCQGITALLSLCAYVPQWLALSKSRSSKEISLQSWTIWACTSFLSLNYAMIQFSINGVVWMLLVSAAGNFICVLVTIALIMHYRKPSASAVVGRPRFEGEVLLEQSLPRYAHSQRRTIYPDQSGRELPAEQVAA